MAGLQKILLIEDNPQIQEIYSVTLSTSNYQVEVAVNGESGLKKAAEFKPDLVFLDIMMPGMSGLEVLSELRKNPEYNSQDAKIVILTNLGHDDRVEEAWQDMADGYVVKSEIQTNEIFEVIRSLEHPDETSRSDTFVDSGQEDEPSSSQESTGT